MRDSGTSRPLVAAFMFALLAAQTDAMAADCQGKPNALGTGRVIAVDPAEHGRIGTMQYAETLPLRDHEVVLTFDRRSAAAAHQSGAGHPRLGVRESDLLPGR